MIIDDSMPYKQDYRKRGFGELIDKKLYLTFVEGIYLSERGMIKVLLDEKK